MAKSLVKSGLSTIGVAKSLFLFVHAGLQLASADSGKVCCEQRVEHDWRREVAVSFRDVGAGDQGMSGYVGDALDGLGYGDWDMAVGFAAIFSIFRAPSSDVEPQWLSSSGFQG